MLSVIEIAEIINKIDSLYMKYKDFYAKLKGEVFFQGTSVKYSSGGVVYPFGKYYFGRSRIFKKTVRQSSGHFCRTITDANFAYVFDTDGKLLAINQMFDSSKNPDGYVYYTSFMVYDEENTFILKYRENLEEPVMCGVGIIYSVNNLEIMVDSDSPCNFFTIVVLDKTDDNEYLYYIGRELFTAEYDLTSDEVYQDYSKLFG